MLAALRLAVRRPRPCAALSLAATIAACGDRATEPAPIAVPVLEAVPYGLLGATTIVFERQAGPVGAELALYRVEGAGQRATGLRRPGAGGPSAVSPDGALVALRLLTTSNTSTFYDVYLMRADGGGLRPVLALPGNVEGPISWTPDGRLVLPLVGSGHQIVAQPVTAAANVGAPTLLAEFAALPGGEVCSWYGSPVAVAANGALVVACRALGLYRIPPGGAPAPLYSPAPETDRTVTAHAPALSPDGARLAFLETSESRVGGSHVTRVRRAAADGSGVVTLATLPFPDSAWHMDTFSVLSLCWTADGQRLVFTAPDGAATSHVYVVDAAGGDVTPLTTAAGAADGSVSCTRG